MKKDYKEVVNTAISHLESEFEGLGKRAIINKVFDYIMENNLITDFAKTSLYNTIYYFLRKRNIFKIEEIKYRFDSISSKLKFINVVRTDLIDRWWFYADLFYENPNRPVLGVGTKIVSGELNYIIDSRENSSYDFLYTLLYFRDLRKIVNSDMSNFFAKRELNDNLYGIFDVLYEMDSEIASFVLSLSAQEKEQLLTLIHNFYGFLSVFDANEYQSFYREMIKNVNAFKKFIKKTNNEHLLKFNGGRFFDAITFANIVYSSAIKHMYRGDELDYYRNVHYLINSTSNFVFFKFSKKLHKSNLNKLIDFFNSDMYFSYSKYIIEYYNMFYNEALNILQSMEGEETAKSILFRFDIVLRYMLYNKFRNLVNSNLKRFICVDIQVTDSCFVDVDDVNDGVLYECELYCNTEPTEDITNRNVLAAYEEFFAGHQDLSKQDITNIAIDICNGTFDPSNYSDEVIEIGNELIEALKGSVV